MDDILVHATNLNTIRLRTRLVFEALKYAGAKLNWYRFKFVVQEMKFLGHVLTPEGITFNPYKDAAIDRIKIPSNKNDLQKLLGMAPYLQKLIPNLSDKTHNMRLLLMRIPWVWDAQLDKDFCEIKI